MHCFENVKACRKTFYGADWWMRGEDIMGKITGICISEKRGVQKHFIEEANIIADWGIEGDAHGGKWHRQISLLSQEKLMHLRQKEQISIQDLLAKT